MLHKGKGRLKNGMRVFRFKRFFLLVLFFSLPSFSIICRSKLFETNFGDASKSEKLDNNIFFRRNLPRRPIDAGLQTRRDTHRRTLPPRDERPCTFGDGIQIQSSVTRRCWKNSSMAGRGMHKVLRWQTAFMLGVGVTTWINMWGKPNSPFETHSPLGDEGLRRSSFAASHRAHLRRTNFIASCLSCNAGGLK